MIKNNPDLVYKDTFIFRTAHAMNTIFNNIETLISSPINSSNGVSIHSNILSNIRTLLTQQLNIDEDERPLLLRQIGVYPLRDHDDSRFQKNQYENDVWLMSNSIEQQNYMNAIQYISYAQTRLNMIFDYYRMIGF